MRFMLVYIGGDQPRLQFITDAWFNAFCAAGGGVAPAISTTPFEDWIWDLPAYKDIYDVPSFSPSQLVDAMTWANQNGQRIHGVPPLIPQFPNIRFVTTPGDAQAADDL